MFLVCNIFSTLSILLNNCELMMMCKLVVEVKHWNAVFINIVYRGTVADHCSTARHLGMSVSPVQ
jgi:hypothetical protein